MASGGWRTVLAGLVWVGLLVLANPPVAQPASEVFRDWQVLEDRDAGDCLLAQTVIGRLTGARLLQAVIQPDGTDGDVTLMLQVPNGVSLADGIAYRHRASDDHGIGLAWQRCDPDWCSAMTALDADEFERLRAGREIIVGYRPLPESRMLNVPLSLLGLTAAWQQMQQCLQ